LRHLADEEIQKAAEAIRQPTEGVFSPLDLFLDRDPSIEMRLEADMLVPLVVEDYFGQRVEPSASLLTYVVAFRYSKEQHRIVLTFEELKYRKKGEAKQALGFPHSEEFRGSVVVANRFGKEFISTLQVEGQTRVQLHQDGGSRGRAVPTGPSPLTILGGTQSKEYRPGAAATGDPVRKGAPRSRRAGSHDGGLAVVRRAGDPDRGWQAAWAQPARPTALGARRRLA